mgnify:CR=1 FL=1
MSQINERIREIIRCDGSHIHGLARRYNLVFSNVAYAANIFHLFLLYIQF